MYATPSLEDTYFVNIHRKHPTAYFKNYIFNNYFL
jgi:hypothetical protein